MRAKRDSIFGFDLSLFAATLILLIIGVLFIYSSAVTTNREVVSNEHIKQIVWSATGLGLMFAATFINYASLRRWSVYICGALLLLVVYALFFGREVHGARSWIGPAGIGVQPSEFAKLGVILLLAHYFSSVGRGAGGVRNLGRFAVALGIIMVPMGLIALQPDLGTALVFISIFLSMALLAGARLRHLAFLIAVGLLTIVLSILPSYERMILGREFPVFDFLGDFRLLGLVLGAIVVITGLAFTGWRVFKQSYFYWLMYCGAIACTALVGSMGFQYLMRPYQIMRFIIFLNPAVDPLGAGWNIIQSKTAVGSGGFWGKGFLMGTQSHLRYLPQQSTDFIFSILAEEWGFAGGVLVFGLYVLVILRGVRIAYLAKDDFGTLVAAGVVGMLFFHGVVNLGMAMGTMPITGIPLYLLSYGGSSIWTVLIALGLLQSIYMRRY